jgi:type II secretory pathway component PulC
MRDNIPPEEKLLRLIKGHKAKNIPAAEQSAPSDTPLKSAARAFAGLSVKKYLSFSWQKIIFFGFFASCIYLAASFAYPWLSAKKIRFPEVVQKKAIQQKIEPKQEMKPFEFYLEAITNRTIFANTARQDTQQPAGIASADLIKDINLVGIISGDNPQAVIEDKKAQKTYYVSKGQSIGELQIEDIQEGKIILNYSGQKYELYL